MSNRCNIRTLGLVGVIVLASMICTSTASASPPVELRGIDLPTVLTFYDRARKAVVARAETPKETSSGHKKLDTIETIVIDPGHGAGNSGAIGITGVAEKYLTLELAYMLRKQIQDRHPDVRVVLTRYWDKGLDLEERTHLANRIDADLFLSLHYNAAVHQRAVGYETYFLVTREAIPGRQQVKGEPIATTSPRVTGIREEDDENEYGIIGEDLAVIQRDLVRARQHKFSGMLAETVQAKLNSNVNSVDRGVKQANFGVLRGALMPAVVVEAGFMTHPDEGRRILTRKHKNKVVDGLVAAIRAFDAKRANAVDE